MFRHTCKKLRWLSAASFSEGPTSESHPEDSLCEEKYSCHRFLQTVLYNSKCKSVPLQAWSGPEGSRK